MSNTTQDGSHAGIQVVRYGITFIPLSFITIAVALSGIGDFLRARFSFFRLKYAIIAVAIILLTPFLVISPLWLTYSTPNNFTNHSAYQYRYDPIDWLQRSPERDLMPNISLAYSLIPKAYFQKDLFETAKGVIEYPMLIGDHVNLYYYFQHFHRLPVVAGYVSNNKYGPIKPGRGFVNASWPIDSVFSAMTESQKSKSSWRTMIDLNNTLELRNRYKGWLLLIHRDPIRDVLKRNTPGNQMSLDMANLMNKKIGNPKYQDAQVTAWLIE